MGNTRTFLIRVIENQNATWQGNVTWIEQKKTENFRSLLELIKMMDGVIELSEEDGGR